MAKKSTVALIVLAIVLTLGGGALLFARLFLFQTYSIPASSMSNTIIPGDQILVFKLFGKPERGDVVVFQYPRGTSKRNPDDTDHYVARIVGLPGETIQMRDRTIYINERPLDEAKVIAAELKELDPLTVKSSEGSGPYQVFYMETPYDGADETPFGTATPFRVPADTYFVMGDNRDNSEDSRYRGPVPRNLIWGQVKLIYLSVSSSGDVRTERGFKRVE